MQYQANTVEEYIDQLPKDRKEPITKLRKVINQNIDRGFSEEINYGMIGWVVPHSLYPNGYHCDPKLPLPFLSIASQKHFIAVYHKGVYTNPQLLEWFTSEYPKYCPAKLDMGKSCIRFKKLEDVPLKVIGDVVNRVPMKMFIKQYEAQLQQTSVGKKTAKKK